MKVLIFSLLFLLYISCEPKTGTELSLELPEEQSLVGNEINIRLAKLGDKIKGIDEEVVLKKLKSEEKKNFLNKLEDLKKHYNETSNLIKPTYNVDELRSVKAKLYQTNEIWKHLVKNYPI